MNFSSEELNAFQTDLKKATQSLCDKYQVKMKKSKISYGQVDFEMKITFEKNEVGLNTERIRFETECNFYGFTSDDYMRLFEYNGVEYEMIGFDRSAKKYNCIVRETETGICTKINEKFLHSLINHKTLHETQPETEMKIREETNLLTEKELNLLNIKLEKSKRNERDWAQIKEVLHEKEVFTFTPLANNPWIKSKQGVAVEDNTLLAFTNKDAIDDYLDNLYQEGRIQKEVLVKLYLFEDIVQIADENNLDIIFDSKDELNKSYLMYNSQKKRLNVFILEKNDLTY